MSVLAFVLGVFFLEDWVAIRSRGGVINNNNNNNMPINDRNDPNIESSDMANKWTRNIDKQKVLARKDMEEFKRIEEL